MKKGNRHYKEYIIGNSKLTIFDDGECINEYYEKLPKDLPKVVIDEKKNVSKEEWKKIKLINEVIKKTWNKECEKFWKECGDEMMKENPLYVWYEENHRHYDKWYKELWWFIREYICEIIITIMSLICIYFIGKALIYGFRENQMQKLSGDISTQK